MVELRYTEIGQVKSIRSCIVIISGLKNCVNGQIVHIGSGTVATILGFDEKDVQFADQLRFFRNGMLYYGTQLDKAYAVKVIEFTKRIYTKLKQLLKL